MSQRTEKVESLILRTVARQLLEYLGGDNARITVTRVDVAPDLRQALVWVGILGDEAEVTELFGRVGGLRFDLQRDVAKLLTTRHAPRLHFRLDTGGGDDH